MSLKLFPWVDYNRTKGGVKLHVVLDHADYLPRFACVGQVREHDVRYARQLQLPKGSIVVIDKGYLDLAMFHRWTTAGVFFVTPEKKKLLYRVVRSKPIPAAVDIRRDEIIQLTGSRGRERYPRRMRRIELDVVDREGRRRRLVVLTNHLRLAASTLAEIYKERWQIELFFKAIKQNLTLRNFVGSTPNALEIQIWTALIAVLLLKWLHYQSQCRWGLSTLAATLRLNLFSYLDLQEFLANPWIPPPEPEQPVQLNINW